MFNLFIGLILIVLGIGFLRDAIRVFRGGVDGKDGKRLWVYQSLPGNIAAAKNRREAMVFTLMCSLLSFFLGLIMIFPYIAFLF